MGKNDNLIIDTNNLSSEYKKILPSIRMLHVNLDNYKRLWYDNVAKKDVKESLLTLISLKNKEDVKRYAESVNDQDMKACANKLMILNENTIESFWNLTTEQENKMMQNTRENIIRERPIKKEKIVVARKLAKMNLGIDVILNATGLSKEEIEKIIKN